MFQALKRLLRRHTREVDYTISPYGFRYRMLDVRAEDGYATAAAALLPGELLYRMMDGKHRVDGKLFPVLMKDETNFAQSMAKMNTGVWSFQLAAGIPVNNAQEVGKVESKY